jgi:hypothetical protein
MIGSFIVGIKHASRSWKMILLLLAVNILFALPMTVPVFLFVMKTTGGTVFAQRLFADNWDAVWLSDMINDQIPGASFADLTVELTVMLCVTGLLYLIANTFLAGGILEVFASEDGRFTMKKFFSGCGAYFWRFFRLFLVSLIFYAIAVGVYVLLTSQIDATDKRATVEKPGALKTWAAVLLLLALFSIVNMIVDYARIGAVVGERRKMFREWFKAARFAFRRFLRAYGLYLTISLTGILVFAFFVWLRGGLHQNSYANVFLAFLVGQTAIASRMWTRMTFYAAELDLYRRFSVAAPASVIEPAKDESVTDSAQMEETGA